MKIGIGVSAQRLNEEEADDWHGNGASRAILRSLKQPQPTFFLTFDLQIPTKMCWDPLPAYSRHAMIFRHLLIRGVLCSAACSSGLRCPADCCSQARVVLPPANSRCAVFRRLLIRGMR